MNEKIAVDEHDVRIALSVAEWLIQVLNYPSQRMTPTQQEAERTIKHHMQRLRELLAPFEPTN